MTSRSTQEHHHTRRAEVQSREDQRLILMKFISMYSNEGVDHEYERIKLIDPLSSWRPNMNLQLTNSIHHLQARSMLITSKEKKLYLKEAKELNTLRDTDFWSLHGPLEALKWKNGGQDLAREVKKYEGTRFELDRRWPESRQSDFQLVACGGDRLMREEAGRKS